VTLLIFRFKTDQQPNKHIMCHINVKTVAPFTVNLATIYVPLPSISTHI